MGIIVGPIFSDCCIFTRDHRRPSLVASMFPWWPLVMIVLTVVNSRFLPLRGLGLMLRSIYKNNLRVIFGLNLGKSSPCCVLYTFNFLIIPLIKRYYIITLRFSESFTVFSLVSQFVFRLSQDGSHGVNPLCHWKVRGLLFV